MKRGPRGQLVDSDTLLKGLEQVAVFARDLDAPAAMLELALGRSRPSRRDA